MIKEKYFPDENYFALFDTETNVTLRFAPNPDKPILPLRYPEILDISLGTKCLANCPFCYTSAIKNGVNYPNLVEKIMDLFGNMNENQRPFQVAIGGGGEPTLHPDFIDALKAFHSLGILPNYTTNGMHLTPEILEATKQYCGGVAVSCHPHIPKIWENATINLFEYGIVTNLHIIVGEPGSTERFLDIYERFHNMIDYFVALPYQAAGRAKPIEVEKEWDKFFALMPSEKIALGALFYDYLLETGKKIPNLSLYEPEVMSGYVMLDENPIIRKSSYDLTPKFA